MYIKPTLRSFLSKIKSNKGFSITEVMVTAGLIGIVSVGATNLISNMQKEQRRNVLLQVLASKKIQIENLIKNQNSWAYTIADATNNANMACLRLQKRCDGTFLPDAPTNMVDTTASDIYVNNTAREIAIYDGAGAIFVDGRQSSNTAGFTESGQACSGFSYTTASGNDACPIGYVVNWRATSNVANPQIYVMAKLVYNPSNASPFKNFVNASAFATNDKFGKYDVNIIRTATSVSKTFTFLSPGSAGAANCSGSGYGSCATGGAYTNYSTYNESYDPHDIAVQGTTSFGIKENGSYKCTVVTYAFATDAVTMELYNSSTSTTLGTAKSSASNGSWGYATVVLETTFNITGASVATPQLLLVRQTCSVTPSSHTPGPNPGDINSCALGFSSGTYSATDSNKASINCVQVNE